MKKRILCMILALMLLGASVILVDAAMPADTTWGDDQIPLSYDELRVTETEDNTFTVTWANPPAASRLRVYVCNGTFEEAYDPVLEPETVSYQKPFTYKVPYRYLTAYGSGGELYQVAVTAIDSNGAEFLACLTGDIAFEYPMLNAPAVSLDSEGVASWETDPDAETTCLSLYHVSGDGEPELIASIAAANALDEDGRYERVQEADLSDHLTTDGTYYVTAYASNPGAFFRDSAESISNAVEYGVAGGFTVSGEITSFLSDTERVEITLEADIDAESALLVEKSAVGNVASFSFTNVPAGEYRLTFAKEHHVTRTETITVSGDVSGLSYKIHPIGDITGDGRITAMDYNRARAHVKGVSRLSGYAFRCADVLGNDNKVTAMDMNRINAHAKGVNLLWK